MNIRTSLGSFLFAGTLALAPVAFAQPGPGPMGGGAYGPGAGGPMGYGGGPGMRGGMGMHGGGGWMMRELNLTEAQQDQIFKIHYDQEPALREQMKKVRAAREDLHKAAIAERYDEGQVRRAADAQAKAISDLAVMHVQTMRRVRDVLTPEQRAKFDQFHQRRPGPGPRPGQK